MQREHLTVKIVSHLKRQTQMLKCYMGFQFYVKKLFTRNIITDVTDGYYVGITVVPT
jgi:hypothetical protein